MNNFVAKNAIIEDDVSIGEDTKVWYFAHICHGAKIGRGCVIGERVYVGKSVIIGDDVNIGNGAQLFEGLIVRNRVRIGSNAVFHNVHNPSWKKAKKFEDTIIDEEAYIGVNTTINAGLKIGKGAHVADGSTVILDVEPFSFVAGPIAKIKKDVKLQ